MVPTAAPVELWDANEVNLKTFSQESAASRMVALVQAFRLSAQVLTPSTDMPIELDHLGIHKHLNIPA